MGIAINDYAHGKLVFLEPKRKVFSETKTILSLEVDSGKISETKVAPMPAAARARLD
jgi:hypothetical protein